MKTRLQQFLQAEDLTPARFADRIGIQRSGVSHVLAGRNKPGFDFIESMLLCYPSLNAEWLMTGKGKMYKEIKSAELFPVEESAVPTTEQDIFSPVQSLQQPEQQQQQQQQQEQQQQQDQQLGQQLGRQPEQQMPPQVHVPAASPKLEKVLLFYSDNTFSEFIPDK